MKSTTIPKAAFRDSTNQKKRATEENGCRAVEKLARAAHGSFS